VQKVLQNRFLIPDTSNYSDEKYFQSASELSVSRYLKQKEKENLIRDLAFEKMVNSKDQQDIDNFFRVKTKNVSIEVKCPFEEKRTGELTMQTAGRIPDPDRKYNSMKQAIKSGKSRKGFTPREYPDNRLKDCLLSSNAQFSDVSSFDDLNLLFVSCGYFHDINHWYMCLHAGEALFTNTPFEAPEHY
jgi:hypothetical protein